MPSSLTTRQPQTPTEWRNAVAEVKRKYVSRKYRACWTRCCELLDGLEHQQQQQQQQLEEVKEEEADGSATRMTTGTETDQQQQESPLVVYRIYLHFYAASSFEMGARPLSTSSPFRGQLLRDARSHYDRAAALIEATEEEAAAVTATTTTTTQDTRSRSRSGSGSALALLANSVANKAAVNSPSLNLAFSATFLHSPSLASSRCSSRASVVSSASSASAPSSPRTSLCSSLDGGESLNNNNNNNNNKGAGAPSAAALPNRTQTQTKESAVANKSPLKKLKKKKVSFSGLPELAADDVFPQSASNSGDSDANNSPRTSKDLCVRPDSPTLGCWEEDMLNTQRQRQKQHRRQTAFLSSPSPSPEPEERRADNYLLYYLNLNLNPNNSSSSPFIRR
ncbi:hypothetical protein UCREL1_11529 [Eutypa lata UCREL1]|uniref:Uncharacterized protein n=1 Tax=Eutypa lata (strain UCR-EL1) TaxID=1287681 RepID=M7SVC7_EUTLA|nr:hypothetical protein UCREL1_11529 [Eutypa lata UCREL1]